jgi:hypothetical protein
MVQAYVPNVSFFQMYVASVFIWMLHMFHTFVVSVLSGYYISFIMVLKCSCKCFRCIFQVFNLSWDILSGCFKSRSGVVSRSILAFDCLVSVSPLSLGVGWASEPEAQVGAVPSPSSQCWRRIVGWRRGLGWREYMQACTSSVLLRGGGIGALITSVMHWDRMAPVPQIGFPRDVSERVLRPDVRAASCLDSDYSVMFLQ